MRKIFLSSLLIGSVSFAANTKYTSTTTHSEQLGPYDRSLASDASYQHGVTPELGFSRGQFVVGADYEYRLTHNFGFGGYFSFTPEKESTGYPQLIALGVDFKAHVDVEGLDLYVRPGFGLAFANYHADNGTGGSDSKSKTFLAPLFGVGAVYRIADNVALGVEHVTFFNWSDKDFLANVEAFMVACQIRF